MFLRNLRKAASSKIYSTLGTGSGSGESYGYNSSNDSFESFVDVTYEEAVEKPRLFIAVVGAAGSGKSSFINWISGSALTVSHDMESRTRPVQLSDDFEVAGYTVTLIDTPGLDVTSGAKISESIHKTLGTPHGTRLHGVIFLQSICASLPKSPHQLLGLSQHLCGEDGMKNLVIVKSLWEGVPLSTAHTRALESKIDTFFQPAKDMGAVVVRHDPETDSSIADSGLAYCVFQSILRNNSEKIDKLKPEFNQQPCQITPPVNDRPSRFSPGGYMKGSTYGDPKVRDDDNASIVDAKLFLWCYPR